MQVGIKTATGIDFLDAVVPQKSLNLPQHHVQSLQQLCIPALLGCRLQTVVEIVQDRQQALQQSSIRVAGRLLHLAGHPLAVIIQFRRRPQRRVLPLRHFHERSIERVHPAIRPFRTGSRHVLVQFSGIRRLVGGLAHIGCRYFQVGCYVFPCSVVQERSILRTVPGPLNPFSLSFPAQFRRMKEPRPSTERGPHD